VGDRVAVSSYDTRKEDEERVVESGTMVAMGLRFKMDGESSSSVKYWYTGRVVRTR
jgi:hypothetical protein